VQGRLTTQRQVSIGENHPHQGVLVLIVVTSDIDIHIIIFEEKFHYVNMFLFPEGSMMK
jgi:hypothetical protein